MSLARGSKKVVLVVKRGPAFRRNRLAGVEHSRVQCPDCRLVVDVRWGIMCQHSDGVGTCVGSFQVAP